MDNQSETRDSVVSIGAPNWTQQFHIRDGVATTISSFLRLLVSMVDRGPKLHAWLEGEPTTRSKIGTLK
jgi:hypothetical protein